ncbi:MAG: glycosyl transferase family 2 [Bacteroidetes bacterium]|nr:MAG: glycosyl transferase family 2 [Bacteroidota bacterium]
MIVLDILFYTFIIITIVQLIYYGFIFSGFAFAKSKIPTQKNIAVSVIICAKNEAKNLQQFLPHILEQDYPNFEIVLINDASHDNTLDIIETFAKTHNNIKIVNVENIEAFWGNKKYALTLGIKAATHDYLLLTDADCKPISKHWIATMSSHFSNTKSIVIGYGSYKKRKYSFLNTLIRYETLLTAIQYFSYAKLGIPYMAVGRNLAYRKDVFFKANGFMSHMNIRSGDDDLFINQVANSKNTSICFAKNSLTESLPETSFKDWLKQKKRHVSTSKYYELKHKFMLGLFYISQLLFWVLSIILLSFQFRWEIVIALILLRIILQYISVGFSAKKLKELDTIVLLPIFDLFLIFSQFFIFISNLTTKPSNWK